MTTHVLARQQPQDTDEQLLRAWGCGLNELSDAQPEELADPWIAKVFNPDARVVDAMARLGYRHLHAIAHIREALEWTRAAQSAIVPTNPATITDFAECLRVLARRVDTAADSISLDNAPPPASVPATIASNPAMEDIKRNNKPGYLGISLDEDKFRATRNGKTADFANNVISWKLFCFMYRRKDAYASQQDLLRAGWTDQHIVAPETVQRHISTIRSIVKRLSVEIDNKRNVGYRLIEKKKPEPEALFWFASRSRKVRKDNSACWRYTTCRNRRTIF